MATDQQEVARHMAAFRRHGDLPASTFSAQFAALLVIMMTDALVSRTCPPDVADDLLTALDDMTSALDAISPGYAVLMRRLLPGAGGRRR